MFEAYTDSHSAPTKKLPVVVSVCGQGSPLEAKFDPDNNRCRPCPHVSDATDAFRAQYAETHPEYQVSVRCISGVSVLSRGPRFAHPPILYSCDCALHRCTVCLCLAMGAWLLDMATSAVLGTRTA